ncbi:MAG: deoxyhypusine synthase family protein [Candidatus Methanomethylophilaceae archaeon]|nr:deoxyhypusine synthase family protein [Candidatus Methanomethylophilaceae archaeon]
MRLWIKISSTLVKPSNPLVSRGCVDLGSDSENIGCVVPTMRYMVVMSHRSGYPEASREAVSWGKVKPDARKVTVEGDATITLPVVYSALMERLDVR